MTADAGQDRTLADLADVLVCSQCGAVFSNRACGPTHALIAADPSQHRALAPLLARVKREAAAEGAVQVLRETADRLDAFRFPTGSDALEPMFRLVASLRARADRLEGATDADH